MRASALTALASWFLASACEPGGASEGELGSAGGATAGGGSLDGATSGGQPGTGGGPSGGAAAAAGAAPTGGQSALGGDDGTDGDDGESGGAAADGGAGDGTGGSTSTGGTSGDGTGGEGSGAGGSGGAAVVHNCTSFEERTHELEERDVLWTQDITTDPARCVEILVGQSVTWTGNFDAHALLPTGGDSPSPIGTDFPASGEHTVVFPNQGTFGYICEFHTEMRGAVRVVSP